ncbi:hypothetical protein QWY93_00080 [Echinicola jeungdonensis]|uniref:hypothetical protein n=1 Tax=Echinicola jeungdonensis TaxID=709343 RepID=UPI0025B45829|nr:hypothetical protein [Echinicola jeungdonensis]MDN3667740.1 hypothetical protein [Echinicola jeungdonensis]
MKNPADKRKQITNQITDNENTNLRIKALLTELKNDTGFENVRPYSPMQQEILKIYENGVLNSNIEIPEDIEKISKKAIPTSSDYCAISFGLNKNIVPRIQVKSFHLQSFLLLNMKSNTLFHKADTLMTVSAIK